MYRKDAVSASNRISNSLGLGVNVKKIPSLSNGTEEFKPIREIRLRLLLYLRTGGSRVRRHA